MFFSAQVCQRPNISYSKQSTYNLFGPQITSSLLHRLHNQDTDAPGNAFGVTEIVSLTMSLSVCRLSINHLATPANSRCATASSHSSLATFRCICDLLSADNSIWCNDLSEHSIRYANEG